jgi:hypothetical protein
MAGCSKYGNEPFGSIRDGALLEQLKSQYVQMDCAAFFVGWGETEPTWYVCH